MQALGLAPAILMTRIRSNAGTADPEPSDGYVLNTFGLPRQVPGAGLLPDRRTPVAHAGGQGRILAPGKRLGHLKNDGPSSQGLRVIGEGRELVR
jgi:hypothetical protein